MSYAIETYDLTKIYKSEEKTVVAVDSLNLNVEKGLVFGLLGPNGAGKTTLIMMLTGLTLPTSGSGKVLGYDIVKESLQIRRKVGLLPDPFGFYDHLTAEQNLEYIAALNDISKAERKKRVKEVLTAVGLYEVKDRKVGGFSRGMKQRLGIAQALIKDPELLIFDEPTAGLDPEGARAFREQVGRLSKEGKTIMLSTHLLFEVGPLCNYIAIIDRGKLIVQGRVRELVEKMMVEEGYRIRVKATGDVQTLITNIAQLNEVSEVKREGDTILIKANRDVRSDVNKIALSLGLEVLSLQIEEPTLEDLFMKYYRRGEVAEHA
ncbi:ABC transporter ATP-binding protein [Candidatus Bathyarchaeota archaeon]|nr:ABC transporter ATP-binding protein [Candidatus Bathyarchaeota archaeon]MBS7617647.1 ABC transporter ATP-binding protein [Candidatus Bathyarchaeota archaeon]